MKTYCVAILGCRSRGTATAGAYHVHPRTAVVGLCDLVEERLNKLGDEIGVSARFADLDEMIRQTEPDIVTIPTGTEFHYDLPQARRDNPLLRWRSEAGLGEADAMPRGYGEWLSAELGRLENLHARGNCGKEK